MVEETFILYKWMNNALLYLFSMIRETIFIFNQRTINKMSQLFVKYISMLHFESTNFKIVTIIKRSRSTLNHFVFFIYLHKWRYKQFSFEFIGKSCNTPEISSNHKKRANLLYNIKDEVKWYPGPCFYISHHHRNKSTVIYKCDRAWCFFCLFVCKFCDIHVFRQLLRVQ